MKSYTNLLLLTKQFVRDSSKNNTLSGILFFALEQVIKITWWATHKIAKLCFLLSQIAFFCYRWDSGRWKFRNYSWTVPWDFWRECIGNFQVKFMEIYGTWCKLAQLMQKYEIKEKYEETYLQCKFSFVMVGFTTYQKQRLIRVKL